MECGWIWVIRCAYIQREREREVLTGLCNTQLYIHIYIYTVFKLTCGDLML